MKNIKLTISYDGSNFYGFQIQPYQRTVQGDLEEAIKNAIGQKVRVIACGRTDTGVHAYKHVSHFHIDTNIPGQAIQYHLAKYLPEDIKVIDTQEINQDFHARYDAKQKTYWYIISNRPYQLAFERNYKVHYDKELVLDKMIEASKKLIGTHDFTAFKRWGDEQNPVRTIDDISIYKKDQDIILEFKGQSFLHNQIRIMVGLLVDIGRGYRDINFIDEIFQGKVERAAKTFGPQGLYLVDVIY